MKKATKKTVQYFKELITRYRDNYLCIRMEEDRPHYSVAQYSEEDENYGVLYELTYSQFKELYSHTNQFICENPYLEMGIH